MLFFVNQSMAISDSDFNNLLNLETIVFNADQGIVISKLLRHAAIIQKIFETTVFSLINTHSLLNAPLQ